MKESNMILTFMNMTPSYMILIKYLVNQEKLREKADILNIYLDFTLVHWFTLYWGKPPVTESTPQSH